MVVISGRFEETDGAVKRMISIKLRRESRAAQKVMGELSG
jgi:hypothetical protein